jgi:poly(3-hydroxybutyrate) depolymerase
VLDVAPQGLRTRDVPGWVNPWEAKEDRPREAPDSLVDVRFIAAIESLVRSTFSSVRRVWLCGFSAGGAVVWSAWALKGEIPHSFAGLGVVGKKLHHKRENGWNWDAANKTPIPFVTVNGTKDDPDEDVIAPREKYSWVDSYAEARAINGNTMNDDATPGQATLCRHVVQLKVAAGGSAPSARYVIDGGGHEWHACSDGHTDDLIIERFAASGLVP